MKQPLVNLCQRLTIFPKNIPKIKVKANRKARLDAIKTNDFDRNPKRNAHIKEEQHMTSEKTTRNCELIESIRLSDP